MGGNKRKGDSHRTKQNVKPSNSGRIANLVDSNRPPFTSFATLYDSQSVSTSHLSNTSVISFEMLDSNVDPYFQVVLKKISKKDATTRYKALQELKDLCKSSSSEVLNQVLPVWARVYCILAIDVEHKVREAVQEVHRLIVNSVGRNLAPYLKKIAPLWFVSQYDTYAPAASVASGSFKEAFSPQKMIEVITYCQSEILSYIRENILNLTPQSLSKGESDKDEGEAKYERIIISSLNGYALYLSKVPPEEIQKFKTINQEILSSPKFWKLSKFKTPAVRAAWFTLVSALSQYGIFLLENEKRQLVNAIIGGIDDYDSAVLTVVWEAALHSFTNIKDFWAHVNIEKFFLLKFCNVLRHGGRGNASFIYPNILLLLNSIPNEVIRDKHQFFHKVFVSFQEGMKQPLVTQSHSESDAVASSFVECIQFLIKINIEDHDFCVFLIEQLMKVMSAYMLLPIYRYQLKSFFGCLSHMLIYWYKNEKEQEKYEVLLQTFWKHVISLSLSNFINSASDSKQFSVVLSTQFQLICIFHSPYTNSKKNLKVTFIDNFKNVNVAEERDLKSSQKTVSEKKFEDDLLVLAKELFQCYYKFCLETENKQLKIQLLSQLCKIIESFNIYLNNFISHLQPTWSSSILLWLKDTDLSMEHILRIMFSSLEFLDPIEQAQLLSELSKERCKESLKVALQLGSGSKNVRLKQWLQSEDIRKEICQTYDSIETNMETAKHFFGLDSDGEFVIGLSAVLSLIDKIEEQLSYPSEANLKKATEVIDAIFNNLASIKQHRYHDIVLRLLDILFLSIMQGHGKIVYPTWKKGTQHIASTALDEHILRDHVKKLSNHLASYIFERDRECDLKTVHRIIITIIDIFLKNDERSMSGLGLVLIETLLSSVCSDAFKKSQRQVEMICLYGDVINGKINSDEVFEDKELNIVKEKWNPLININVLGYAKVLNYVLRILSTIFGVEMYDEENEDDCDDYEGDKSFSLPIIPNELKKKCDAYIVCLSLGLVLFRKMKIYYYNTREFFDIRPYIEPLERFLKEIVQRCEPMQQKRIIETLSPNEMSQSAILWSEVKELIFDFLGETMQDNNTRVVFQESETSDLVLEKNVIQKLRKHLKSVRSSSFDFNENLKTIAEKYKNSFLNMNKDSIEMEPDYFPITTELVYLLQEVITAHPTLLSMTVWDFARIAVTKWLSVISQTEDMSHNYLEYVTLTAATCKLLKTISKVLSHEPSLENYCEEWRELFATEAYYCLCKHWKNVTEKSIKNGVNYMSFLHIVLLSETISDLCDSESFHKIKPVNGDVKEWVDFTVTCILAPCVPVQLTSYKMLQVLLPNLMKLDEGTNEECLDKISCNLLEPKLMETQTVFMTMLQDFSVGVSCSVAPFTDSYTYSLAYLLLWSILIKMCQEGDAQQKYIYPLWIKEKDIIFHFIEGIVKLMPESVIYFQENYVKKGQDLFVVAPSYTFYDWTSEKLSHLSCWLLTELMASLPAAVRQWASEAEPKLLTLVDRIVTAFVTPNLASREMSSINKQQKSFDNMKVYTHPSVREVVAVYTVEESSTELVVQLANNHPLSPPKVDISKAMISSNQTRQWLKQLTIFLTHQNGSIWDGLVLWKSNLDKKFEGIDECYICFSILHNTTHQLPKLSCHTCKKKFHSYCLYKWFSTSHKSTCPICRAIF